MSHPILFLLAAHLIVTVAAQRNITVDDKDPLITYSGTWSLSAPSTLDQDGSHQLAEDDASFAKFTFTGTAVYFMSPLWPYDVFTQVTLDSQPPVELTLSDPNKRDPSANGPETVQSAVVWGSGPLSNTPHTLVVAKIPRPDRPYAIVDAIVYTVQDSPPVNPSSISSLIPSTPSSTSTSSSSTTRGVASSTNTSNGNTSSSSHVLPIALGTVLGSLGLLVIAVVLWLCCKGKRRPQSEAWTVTGASEGASSSPHAIAPPPPGGHHPPSNQHQHQIQHPYNPYPNYSYQQPPYTHNSPDASSWSAGSGTQMSSTNTGVPLVANAQPPAYYDNPLPPHPQPSRPVQDFNPWVGVPPMQQQQQPQPNDSFFHSSGRYAPTTLSTITETSTPGGTVASNRSPALGAGASPASFPSADLSYYTPPQETGGGGGPGGGGNAARFSYASDGSSASAAYQQQQQQNLYSRGSAGQLRHVGSAGTTNSGGGTRW